MKHPYSLFLFLFFTLTAYSQKKLPEFGKIDIADLQMKQCSFEPEASAMKLLDLQDVEFQMSEYSTRIETQKRVRIKVFSEKGYEYASIKIPYYSKKRISKIKDLSGVIYNLDSAGNIVVHKLEKKDFFKEKSEDNLGVINFTFPNLKPGSVIEYSYTRIDKNNLQIEPWVAQDEIPVAYASATIITPSYAKIKEKISGTMNIDIASEKIKGDRYKTIYYKENVKSFHPEPFMSSYRDNLLHVAFLLTPADALFDLLSAPKAAWSKYGRDLLRSEDFGGQIRKNIPNTDKLVDSAKAIKSVDDRIGFIYQAVQKRLPDKGEQTMYPNDVIEAWNNKSGNTAEVNLILLNLLRKSDVDCYPILISTREHGKISEDFPSVSQMNGVDVIAVNGDKNYLLDATVKFQSYLNPPFNVLNREGYVLIEGNMQWVSISDDRPLIKQDVQVIMNLKEDGKSEGITNISYFDYAKSYALDTTDDDEEKNDKFFDKNPIGLKITSVSQENADSATKPLLKHIEFEYEPQETNDFYFISPQFMTSKKDNPFTKTTRTTDIDFGCNQQLSFAMQLDLPKDFTVDQLPRNITVRAPDSSFFFKRNCSINADSSLISLYTFFEVKRPEFDKEEYEGVHEFFNRVYPLMSEEIILKKKKK
jgi:uncharacterized protein DUF3857